MVKQGHIRTANSDMCSEQQNAPVGSGLQFLKLKEIIPEEELEDDEEVIQELNSDSESKVLSQPLTVPVFKKQKKNSPRSET